LCRDGRTCAQFRSAACLNVNVIAPIGGVFDFYTGRVKLPPKWIQRLGLIFDAALLSGGGGVPKALSPEAQVSIVYFRNPGASGAVIWKVRCFFAGSSGRGQEKEDVESSYD
jgi:hypothetical protein